VNSHHGGVLGGKNRPWAKLKIAKEEHTKTAAAVKEVEAMLDGVEKAALLTLAREGGAKRGCDGMEMAMEKVAQAAANRPPTYKKRTNLPEPPDITHTKEPKRD
jgi:hypothetical protein